MDKFLPQHMQQIGKAMHIVFYRELENVVKKALETALTDVNRSLILHDDTNTYPMLCESIVLNKKHFNELTTRYSDDMCDKLNVSKLLGYTNGFYPKATLCAFDLNVMMQFLYSYRYWCDKHDNMRYTSPRTFRTKLFHFINELPNVVYKAITAAIFKHTNFDPGEFDVFTFKMRVHKNDPLIAMYCSLIPPNNRTLKEILCKPTVVVDRRNLFNAFNGDHICETRLYNTEALVVQPFDNIMYIAENVHSKLSIPLIRQPEYEYYVHYDDRIEHKLSFSEFFPPEYMTTRISVVNLFNSLGLLITHRKSDSTMILMFDQFGKAPHFMRTLGQLCKHANLGDVNSDAVIHGEGYSLERITMLLQYYASETTCSIAPLASVK